MILDFVAKGKAIDDDDDDEAVVATCTHTSRRHNEGVIMFQFAWRSRKGLSGQNATFSLSFCAAEGKTCLTTGHCCRSSRGREDDEEESVLRVDRAAERCVLLWLSALS